MQKTEKLWSHQEIVQQPAITGPLIKPVTSLFKHEIPCLLYLSGHGNPVDNNEPGISAGFNPVLSVPLYPDGTFGIGQADGPDPA